jgi:hypothetical protein
MPWVRQTAPTVQIQSRYFFFSAAPKRLSGSQMMLPPLSPLRTVRESFPSYGSSLSYALFRTRLLNVQTLAVDLHMAIWVQEHTVFRAIRPALRSPNDVMVVPSRQFGDLLVTDRATPVLFSPEMQQLFSPFEVACHLDAEALLEVGFPRRIERVGCSLYLNVPFYRHAGCGEEAPCLVADFSAEDPVPPFDGSEILVPNPSPWFV